MTTSLQPFNTLNLAQSCSTLIRVDTYEKLKEACLSYSSKNVPFFILGGGSNIVLTEDFQGVVIRIETRGVEIRETNENYHVSVEAGENWHHLVSTLLDKGVPGLENLALIPGVAGAAPIQNIGAYGVEFDQVCEWVEYLDLQSGELVRLSNQECCFGYRDSIFKQSLRDRAVVVRIGLKLTKSWQPNIDYGPLQGLSGQQIEPKQVFQAVCDIRSNKLPDPRQLGNVGSFFKNPIVSIAEYERIKAVYPSVVAYPHGSDIKLAAGWLIDNAGLKGKRLGSVGVHQEQALVLVNYGGASGQDICQLAQLIMKQVYEFYGVKLEVEPRVLTAFGEGVLEYEG
ncbi:UDP-N-acetylmuramate dehydrogenase [Shewanella gelidii]|uniref:UDP-N-acetylenolpyruvoylglucosamine reductase n=1 Tax=Shewanella gelidii TaxID=1642821 RepID=A0A917JYP0_9GAMM|nr:UDP-N-acetylmuramate dehydrogenase [Shewanella gelidii]MCL1099711.1 UDP-N-acetylmuramate dehydrogenase [Shewanella gelidii]GGI93152.1 UDP-N-acetylenolpyruvoylglucosamine reductase [Shewanella gelidii]